jgi:hypothetical protein
MEMMDGWLHGFLLMAEGLKKAIPKQRAGLPARRECFENDGGQRLPHPTLKYC